MTSAAARNSAEEAPAARRATRPHAPERGRVRRLLGPFYVTGVFWYRLPYWAIQRGILSVRTFPAFVRLFATLFSIVLWNIRDAIAGNLEAVLGPCGFWERQRRIYRTIEAFSWCYGARYEQIVHPGRFRVEVEGAEHVPTDPERGVVFVTAHIGQWELSSHLASHGQKRPVHVVREEEMDPDAQRFIEGLVRDMSADGVTTHFASDDPRLALTLAEALRRGDVVALQGDRPRIHGRTHTARLFGRPMPLPIGPQSLARATGAALVPVFSFREGRYAYRVVVRPPIPVQRTRDRDADVADAVQRLAAEIEWAIRRAPHQWFCLRRLWDRARHNDP
jgi:KDO2-lipid IV(A) lauroyltransferase